MKNPNPQDIDSTLHNQMFNSKCIDDILCSSDICDDDIESYAQAFGIQQGTNVMQKMVSKICSIFSNQKEQYRNYLNLPRIQAFLTQNQQLNLSRIFDQIWNKIKDQSFTDRKRQKSICRAEVSVSDYLSPLYNYGQAAELHLGILNMFMNSPFCALNNTPSRLSSRSKQFDVRKKISPFFECHNPISYSNSINQKSPFQNIYDKDRLESLAFETKPDHQWMSHANRVPPNYQRPLVHYPKSQNSQKTKRAAISAEVHGEKENNKLNNSIYESSSENQGFYSSQFDHQKWWEEGNSNDSRQQNLRDRDSNLNPALMTLKNGFQGQGTDKESQSYSNHYQQMQKALEDKNTDKEAQESPESVSTYITGEPHELAAKIREYDFIECPCSTEPSLLVQGQMLAYFTCQKCEFNFHFRCVGKSPELHHSRICPICTVKQINILEEPIVSVCHKWLINSGSIQSPLKLRPKDAQIIKNAIGSRQQAADIPNPSKVDLKMIRIKSQDNAIQDSQNASQQALLSSLNLNQFLPGLYNQKEIVLSGLAEDQQQKYKVFGCICVLRVLSKREKVESLFNHLDAKNSVGEQFLTELWEKKRQTVKVDLRCKPKSIEYPVRGNNCTHGQVLDYETMVNELSLKNDRDLQVIKCSIKECGRHIDYFIADRFIYEQIRAKDSSKNNHPLIKNCQVQLLFKRRYKKKGKSQEVLHEGSAEDNDGVQ